MSTVDLEEMLTGGTARATTQPDHSQRAHATLSASSAYRWMNCLGSIRMSEGLPNVSSAFAREGTAGHEMAEQCLSKGIPAHDFIGKEIDGFLIDEDWADAIQVYLDECNRFTGDDWEVFIEKKFSLEKLLPPAPMFGTTDFSAYSRKQRLLSTVDLKFGKGVAVEAVGNPQPRFYGLGTMLALPERSPVEKVELVIVQPRIPYGDTIKRDVMDAVDLMEWSSELLYLAEQAMKPDAPLKAGSWCKFCLAKGRCPEQAKVALEAAQTDFASFLTPATVPEVKQAAHLTLDELELLVQRAPLIEAFLDGAKEALKATISQGVETKLWKLVPTQARRKWSEEEDMTATLLTGSLKLKDEEVWERKLRSPAKVEAALIAQGRATGKSAKDAKAQAKELLDDMVTTASSGTTLAPFSDPRPAIGARGTEFELLPAPATTVNQ